MNHESWLLSHLISIFWPRTCIHSPSSIPESFTQIGPAISKSIAVKEQDFHPSWQSYNHSLPAVLWIMNHNANYQEGLHCHACLLSFLAKTIVLFPSSHRGWFCVNSSAREEEITTTSKSCIFLLQNWGYKVGSVWTRWPDTITEMHPSPKREVHVTLGIRGFYSPRNWGLNFTAQMADIASKHVGK